MRVAIAAAVLALAGCQMPPPVAHNTEGGTKRVTGDPGGDIDARFAEISRLEADGVRVVIDGPCWSACTFYLSMPDTCVTPRASMRFHGPVHPFTSVAASEERGASARSVMLDAYSGYPLLMEWIVRNDVLAGAEWHDLGYEQLVYMGVPMCST